MAVLFQEWAARAEIPSHVVTMLSNFPHHVHPMAQFSSAIVACNTESKFAKAYSDGANKTSYWEVSEFEPNSAKYVYDS